MESNSRPGGRWHVLGQCHGPISETFPRVYVAMVEAGETGGFLDLVLGQISTDFQSRDKGERFFSAMIYPVVLLFLALGVLVFLMMFFIPRFKVLFEVLMQLCLC